MRASEVLRVSGAQLRDHSSTLRIRDASLREHRYPINKRRGTKSSLTLFTLVILFFVSFQCPLSSGDIPPFSSFLGRKRALKHQHLAATCILNAPSVRLIAASANLCHHASSYRHIRQKYSVSQPNHFTKWRRRQDSNLRETNPL